MSLLKQRYQTLERLADLSGCQGLLLNSTFGFTRTGLLAPFRWGALMRRIRRLLSKRSSGNAVKPQRSASGCAG